MELARKHSNFLRLFHLGKFFHFAGGFFLRCQNICTQWTGNYVAILPSQNSCFNLKWYAVILKRRSNLSIVPEFPINEWVNSTGCLIFQRDNSKYKKTDRTKDFLSELSSVEGKKSYFVCSFSLNLGVWNVSTLSSSCTMTRERSFSLSLFLKRVSAHIAFIFIDRSMYTDIFFYCCCYGSCRIPHTVAWISSHVVHTNFLLFLLSFKLYEDGREIPNGMCMLWWCDYYIKLHLAKEFVSAQYIAPFAFPSFSLFSWVHHS